MFSLVTNMGRFMRTVSKFILSTVFIFLDKKSHSCTFFLKAGETG